MENSTKIPDARYQRLLREHKMRSKRLIGQLATMNREQQDAVLDYIGLLAEIHRLQLAYKLETEGF